MGSGARPIRLPEHPLDARLEPLRQRRSRRLQGPDAQEWRLAIEWPTPDWLAREVPPGALVFANDGYGNYLFLVPDPPTVQVFWHDERGADRLAEYCGAVEDLLPNTKRPPSSHGPVRYFGSQETVQLGDRVLVRYLLLFRSQGMITYVPGVSPLKRELENGGLAWVRVKLENGGRADVLVESGRLRKTVTFLARGEAIR